MIWQFNAKTEKQHCLWHGKISKICYRCTFVERSAELSCMSLWRSQSWGVGGRIACACVCMCGGFCMTSLCSHMNPLTSCRVLWEWSPILTTYTEIMKMEREQKWSMVPSHPTHAPMLAPVHTNHCLSFRMLSFTETQIQNGCKGHKLHFTWSSLSTQDDARIRMLRKGCEN